MSDSRFRYKVWTLRCKRWLVCFSSTALFLDLCRSSLERAGTILYVGRVRLVVGISDLAVPYRAELEEGVVGFQISTVKTVCDEKRTSFTIYHKGRSSGYVLYLEG